MSHLTVNSILLIASSNNLQFDVDLFQLPVDREFVNVAYPTLPLAYEMLAQQEGHYYPLV